MANDNQFFSRSEALLGEKTVQRLANSHVLVVGVGGVGSWCAEALVRTGVGHLTLMDDDTVATSNVNRQCPATSKTIGRPKVDALAERLREINPSAEIRAMVARYPFDHPTNLSISQSVNSLISQSVNQSIEQFSLVIDAIDSVDCKARLILNAFAAHVPIISSMGAALRMDPTKVRLSRFDKVQGDGLAKALRNRFRRIGAWPGKFMCVWSEETPLQVAERGSVMPVTATFGMSLAAEAIRQLSHRGEE